MLTPPPLMDSMLDSSLLAEIALLAGAPRLEGYPPHTLDANPRFAPVVSELRRRLGISPQDDSRAALNLIARAAGTEVTRLSLMAIDKTAVRKRLGELGGLRSDDFIVAWAPGRNPQESSFGVRPSQAIEVAKFPDAAQHLLPYRDGAKPSVYLKHIQSKRGGDSATVMVLGERVGDVILISGAFRIFPDVVDIASAREPMDVLRAFCSVYCYEITIGSKTGKLIFDEVAVVADGGHVIAQWENKGPIDLHVIEKKAQNSDVFHVAVAFALDLDTLWSALRDRGFLVPQPHGPLLDGAGQPITHMRLVVHRK